ncbi:MULTISPECIES: sulfite exporter TauE/SafE family protein [Microcystis]|uniref:sulfite exporter TauE/SafE family protein n=1 Tax=Microcystis TaxID=1125 RepID=UPI00077695A1|nr:MULTISPECIES: sulfite exporter TauE/SafE family protein [Microcystis]MCA2901824.1 sulfite exporter TauE/SafE family protein [Microcystis sp. M035S1]KXS90901.1 permease [Microcystis aeruginosa NIES-88]MCA2722142.1 sulfite exporter TauE/SafE family protein [Microcystis sp. M176S2]MCA2726288.1 sulfite exporter TauE/SafE family protein [Microcystis sp. M166S2]MCA2731062.1 sulfite exporter TauE/SafE family protein [Microcystis sp. M162S2]
MLTPIQYGFLVIAAVAAGLINALAGGGSLITFPTLMAVGIPPVMANVTNTVALCPGYLGATLAQKKDLHGQQKRIQLLLPSAVIGGIIGGILLLNSSDQVFDRLIPFLILLAAALLAFQDTLRSWLQRRQGDKKGNIPEIWAVLPIALASIYGGYFGAGLGVIELAILGLFIKDNLTRLNALKQLLSLVVNVAASWFFLFSNQVYWSAAIVVAIGSLIGGLLGGKLARIISPSYLRWTVVILSIITATVYFLR